MNKNQLEIELLEKYKKILEKENYPNWAFKLYPALPFIGNNYYNMNCKLLLYGSAENLSYCYNKRDIWINNIGDNGFLRNRYCFEKNKHKNDFFPNEAFHMQPIKDGSLLTVSKYIVETKFSNNNFSNNPYEFLEQIAIGNIAKFSIEKSDNEDYPPKSKKKLMCSFSYIVEEIKLLRPDVIILPVTVYYKINGELNNLLKQINLKSEIIGVYQVNPQAINNSIKMYLTNKNLNYTNIALSPVITNWCKNVKMRNKRGCYKDEYVNKLMKMYLTWLNDRL